MLIFPDKFWYLIVAQLQPPKTVPILQFYIWRRKKTTHKCERFCSEALYKNSTCNNICFGKLTFLLTEAWETFHSFIGARQKAKLLTVSFSRKEKGSVERLSLVIFSMIGNSVGQLLPGVATEPEKTRSALGYPVASFCFTKQGVKRLGKLIFSERLRVKSGHLTQKKATGKDFTQRRRRKAKVLIN